LQEKLSKVYFELEAIDSDKAPSRAAKILSGLGFSPDAQKKKTWFVFSFGLLKQ
jgi:ATP-binding cassette subfamily F protein 3